MDKNGNAKFTKRKKREIADYAKYLLTKGKSREDLPKYINIDSVVLGNILVEFGVFNLKYDSKKNT